MSRRIFLLTTGVVLILGVSLNADTLKLKDGRVIKGLYKNGTASTISFEANGKTSTYPVETIESLTFQRAAPKPATTSKSPQGSVTVNPGTQLMVRTQSALITGKTSTGDRFTAELEADMVANGVTIAPRGSMVYGRVVESVKGRRIAGRAKLIIELTDVMINDQLHPLFTSQIGYEGERSGTLKKIALGTAAGAVIDGSEGAGKGAAVGAGAAVLTKGKQIEIPAGSILEFRTAQPMVIQFK